MNVEQLKTWFKGLQPRERTIVLSAGVLISVAILYLGIFGPLVNAVATREARINTKQQDLVWMRSVANNVRMASAAQAGGAGGESLVVLINRTAQQAGIASALVNQAPSGENSIRVRLERANFDAVVAWIGSLQQQYSIRVETASIDRGEKPGVINASLVLTRGG